MIGYPAISNKSGATDEEIVTRGIQEVVGASKRDIPSCLVSCRYASVLSISPDKQTWQD